MSYLKMFSVAANLCTLTFTSLLFQRLTLTALIINSFESIKISLTNLILKLVIQKNFHSETRLVRLI